MQISEESINHNALRLIRDSVGTSYDMIMANGETDYQFSEERAYMMMALGEVQGIINMAQAMKEVLKA